MRTIGLVGGMSWESTVTYYAEINRAVQARLGGLHSAKLLLWSVDFQELEARMRTGEWTAVAETLAAVARRLEAAGAELLLLATNTMHKVAPAIERAVQIPLLHIADPTGVAIRGAGHGTVGLLGTRFTMEETFYRERLRERHGLETLVPRPEDRALVDRVIFDELCLGKLEPASRDAYRRVMADLVARGAQAIALACTEIALLVRAEDATVPLFDTTALHARAAVDWALAEG